MDEYAQQWVARVRAEKSTFLASQMYAGQGIKAAQEAAMVHEADLFIVSAGLSVVSPTKKIPSYNLTVGSEGPNPLGQTIEDATPVDWWQALNRAFNHPSPLARLIRKYDSRVLIALPDTYLKMVGKELSGVSAVDRKKVRIITSSKTVLDANLADIAIRYDQRFNRVLDAPHGANASFVQRALLHFSILLAENPRISALASQQSLVDQVLERSTATKSTIRKKITDDALRVVMNSLMKEKIISKTRLLEKIRHSKNLACEQNRFNRLYDEILPVRK
ncbi:hypothetical protein [Herbaspirillum rhizosphaerae]|uniref:hypothetical protein n=1 Tax=Herbaspirillum rhizosphaerae TaxID=346179 RepID=UPI00142F28AD|nr:hypothetical protein [Herbaspirillum rhizosphaerae]